MADPHIQPDSLEVLADDFTARWRRGESPSVSEFADRHHMHAEQIRNLFPAIAMMERLRSTKAAEHEASVRRAAWSGVPMDLGELKIIREIGRGGMGIVFEAQQRSLDRRVAVKVLPNHALLREKDLQRFRREAQTAAGLHHTNIVPVHGVGEHEGVHYYVMPLIRGAGLDEIIGELRATVGRTESAYQPRLGIGHLASRLALRKSADVHPEVSESDNNRVHSTSSECEAGASTPKPSRRPQIPRRLSLCRKNRPQARNDISPVLTSEHWSMVADVGLQAAGALDFAHAHGTLHRDVKPGNLLVDAEGVIRVADFGLARAMDRPEANRSGDALGTLRYMAPEQMAGRADARSDIYSLGLTLYELATLQPAFADARRQADGRHGHSEAAPVRPAKLAPSIPRDLETIILRCLADQPSHRYQRADQLAADLRRYLDDMPIHARRVSTFERVRRWSRRNPALAAVSTMATLLLIALLVTAAIGYVKTRAAHTKTRVALTRAEANSELALDVLENIYRQCSPDQFGVCLDSHGAGEPCVLMPSSSYAKIDISFPNSGIHVQPSQETALLLENLLGFYDQLAKQAGDDCHVLLESALASRRVGDIRQRLGQPDLAERAYQATIKKLSAIQEGDEVAEQIATELARNYNEIGNVRSARLDAESAYASHQRALTTLLGQAPSAAERSASYQYELARTLYLLTNSMPTAFAAPRVRGSAAVVSAAPNTSYRRSDYRRQASRILESLVRRHGGAPGYRFLLALCRRPLRPVTLNSRDARARQEAIEILQELSAEYPNVADYRHELATTYAWLHVGLYPWQTRVAAGRDVEPALRRALDESKWLVDHNPSIPHYACSQAVILAKLGTVCSINDRLPEAQTFFQAAFETQDAAVESFPDIPSHNRVLREFLRLRAAEAFYKTLGNADGKDEANTVASQLDICIDNLTELLDRPDLTDDRLARFTVREACRVRSSLELMN